MQAVGYFLSCLSDEERERKREEKERDRETQVQTSPASLVSVIDALMGVGGGDGAGLKGIESRRGLQRPGGGPLISQRSLVKDKREGADERSTLMHLHLRLHPPTVQCSLHYQQQSRGGRRAREDVQ